MTNIVKVIAFVAFAFILVSGGRSYNAKLDKDAASAELAAQEQADLEIKKLKESMNIEDLIPGTGAEAKNGDIVSVQYVGNLKGGAEFDNSYKRGRPFEFTLGSGGVIKGWDLGLLGLKVGGTRKLTIPPELGYGARGNPPVIPENATLEFVVELLDIKK